MACVVACCLCIFHVMQVLVGLRFNCNLVLWLLSHVGCGRCSVLQQLSHCLGLKLGLYTGCSCVSFVVYALALASLGVLAYFLFLNIISSFILFCYFIVKLNEFGNCLNGYYGLTWLMNLDLDMDGTNQNRIG